MQLIGDAVVFSATDLVNFIACEHLTTLDFSVLRGTAARPRRTTGITALLADLGDQHERAYLASLRAQGLAVVEIDRARGVDAAVAATERAMAAGAPVIYQATFFDGTWIGYADFLRRVDDPLRGGNWPWHYEVEDTKLARHTEPHFLLQLCYYSEHVARVQGVAPRGMYVVQGDGTRLRFLVDDAAAYYRSVKARFLARLHDEQPTYPVPVDHCELCVWDAVCSLRRRDDDHLSGVAGITRLQTARLEQAGIRTLAALGAATAQRRPEEMIEETFDKLRRQARLQDEQRTARAAREPHPDRFELIAEAIEAGKGLFRLPEPSPGDVFFDMEGDPYYDLGTGLEYLFGAATPDGAFRAFWGCDRTSHPVADRRAEKQAFEAFVDFVMARRAAHPTMHVYHYAPYEKTALQKLSLRHATREDEVDVLLREERLVDLYHVVKAALVAGQPSYSIKRIEEYYGRRGDESGVKGGAESILRFEEWRTSRFDPALRDDAILADLERYNQYDCVSTYELREWLLSLRAGALASSGSELPYFTGTPAGEQKVRKDPKYADLVLRLASRIPADFDPETPDPRAAELGPLLLARHMLEYHWREDKPEWWRFFDRCDQYERDPKELLDDSEAILGLEPTGEPPDPVRKSFRHVLRFPAQLHKIGTETAYDPRTKESAGKIVAIEDGDDHGTLILERGPSLAGVPLPSAVIVRSIVPASSILDAIARFGEALLSAGAACRYRAAYDVLTRAAPRLRGGSAGGTIQPAAVTEASVRAVADALDDSYLFVQGPPGAGKTYIGARLVVDRIARGHKVGITANSHKAIHNLLDEVEKVAAERGVTFVGVKKYTKDADHQMYHGAHFRNDANTLAHDDADLVAGTAWAFGPLAMDQRLDLLVIDEAGQVALPAAIAVMTSARNVVLLGDPLQLPQVAHTSHPCDIGVSVLEHLLGGELRPVAPDRGILLLDSYRMHPDVCRFISDLLYEGKLQSAHGRERQRVESPGLCGTGLRYLPVPHAFNTQRSTEEARAIADEIELLLHGTVTDVDGVIRPLTAADIMVVTPYNAQVTCIRRELASRPNCAGVEVGTVDKFQGREAYVVFFATAASSPEDAPRGVGFVFDRQRFNVAISRARALAVMVGSPDVLLHRCTSVEAVRVANGVCRFVELAEDARSALVS
jgi:predicted RecB family nuclease